MNTTIKAVIADLAGTTVDFGSCAPAGVFVEVLRRAGVEISLAEARGPMGMSKKDHIRELLRLPNVSTAWRDKHGNDWDERDVEDIYNAFIPLQLECLADYNELIPGVLETVNLLKSRGIKLGVNTGYTRDMTDIVLDGMKAQGIVPDASCCYSDVPAGRPAPWMIFHTMEQLDVCPPCAVVAIGDTLSDIEAGRNAGVWTVGITRTGNLIGMNAEEVEQADPTLLASLIEEGTRQLIDKGAHYVVESFAELPAIIDVINERMKAGDRP